ncbi:MAG: hypothetical protein ACQRW7_13610 [Caulobacterales bacterium]|uniref:hypothetical protein n=1 Tax=Glycocaulis sp. TaxID=1969725 RepID=UPI003F9F8E43
MHPVAAIPAVLVLTACNPLGMLADGIHDDVLHDFPPTARQTYVANFAMDCREGAEAGEALCRTCTVMALGEGHGFAVDAELYEHTLRERDGGMFNAISAPLGREDFAHDGSPESVRIAVEAGHDWCAAQGEGRLAVLKDELAGAGAGGMH